jgi:hypothetical protein
MSISNGGSGEISARMEARSAKKCKKKDLMELEMKRLFPAEVSLTRNSDEALGVRTDFIPKHAFRITEQPR